MHYHLEVILPPGTDDIEAAVKSVMEQFDENGRTEEGERGYAFWDFYVIGGRSAGEKMLAKYDAARIEEFEQWLRDENVTVSSLRCGKPTLQPANQREKVDAKWNEMFPSEGGVMVACPLFDHSNDQYGRDGKGTIDGDICPLGEARSVKCARVIVAGPSYDHETKERTGPLKPVFMLCEDQWNGVNRMRIDWDGTVGEAVTQCAEKFESYKDEYRELMTPTDDWITVTVDYHS